MRACTLLLALSLASASAAAPLRRFALIAGNDEGGRYARPLRFAREDARRVHDVLLRLGGVRADDAVLLLNADAATFLSTLGEVERRASLARANGEQTLLLLYYSGHAREGVLELGASEIPFPALKSRLAQGPADIRIGIFDACRAGGLARRKGARAAPAFDIQADPGTATRGVVVLTSSSSDEDSQESDALAGSYFSHHFTSGLLGGADRSADGRITLAEAYAYAYERTLADTADSGAGPQHPTFSFDLAGNGDLTLTELEHTEGLTFPAQLAPGPYFVVSDAGLIVAEIQKSPGLNERLSLLPGHYRLKRRLSTHLQVADVSIGRGAATRVDAAMFRDAPFSDDPVKGAPRDAVPHVALAVTGGYQSFFDADTRAQLFPSSPRVGIDVQLHDYVRKDWVIAFDAAFAWGRGSVRFADVRYPFRAYQAGVGASGWVEWPIGWVVPFAGIRVAWLWMGRTFDEPAQRTQTFQTLTPGLLAGVRFTPWRHAWFMLRGHTHYLLYNVDGNRSLGYWELNAGVGHDF